DNHHRMPQWRRRILYDIPFMRAPLSLLPQKLRNLKTPSMASRQPDRQDHTNPTTVSRIAGGINTLTAYLPVIKELFTAQRYENNFITRFGLLETAVSVLVGIAWWAALYYMRFLRTDGTRYSYLAYILIGTQIWAYCMAIHRGTGSIFQKYKLIIWQWKIPAEIFILFQVCTVTFRYLLIFSIITLLLHFNGTPFQPEKGLFVLLLAPLIALFTATGLMSAAISVVWSHATRAIQGTFTLLFIMTPIVYPLESITDSRMQTILRFNPLTHLVGSCREWFFAATMDSWQWYAGASLLAGVLFSGAILLIRAIQETLYERMYL
ncbi:MAG: ABC transporter permease, partial [Chitinivibrionales bacterium]|nr:ABC transporter permease [Chitinivibrionales bacterium]